MLEKEKIVFFYLPVCNSCRIWWWQLWTGSVLAGYLKYLLKPVGLETGSVSGFDRGLLWHANVWWTLVSYVSVLELIGLALASTLHSVCPLARGWWENDRWDWSLCCRGDFGLVMDPVHSAGSVVWLVFWAFALFCLVVFFVEDFHCLNLFCTFFT